MYMNSHKLFIRNTSESNVNQYVTVRNGVEFMYVFHGYCTFQKEYLRLVNLIRSIAGTTLDHVPLTNPCAKKCLLIGGQIENVELAE